MQPEEFDMQWGKIKMAYWRGLLLAGSLIALLVAAGAGSQWD